MKQTKTRARLTLAGIFILTVVLAVIGVTGIPAIGVKNWLPSTNADNWPEALPLGLDLRGGVYVEYSAARPDDGTADFDALLETTMSVIRTRLGDKGYSEATVQRLGDEGIRVEIPDVTDTAYVLELIGEPTLLEFTTPYGETFMTGEMVSSAEPGLDQYGRYVINFRLNKQGDKPLSLDNSSSAAPARPIDLAEQDDLTRFDKVKRRRKNNKKGQRPRRNGQGDAETPAAQ